MTTSTATQWNLSIASGYPALFHPSTTVEGKFYDAIVVRAWDANGNEYYFPVYNYGAGQASRFTTGAIVLDSAQTQINAAIGRANNKRRAKVQGGYSEDLGVSTLQTFDGIPPKVRSIIEASLKGAASLNPLPAPAPKFGATAGAPPPKPKKAAATKVVIRSVTANAPKFEEAVTAILGISDPEVALAKLSLIKAKLEDLRTDVADAESAVEMADLYVRSRLQ